MPNYVQDPNDSTKQIPGPPPDNYYDRIGTFNTGSLIKTPNHIYIKANLTGDVKFFFGSSASFASQTDYTNYQSFGALTAGTKLEIHPSAWSGSIADNDAGLKCQNK